MSLFWPQLLEGDEAGGVGGTNTRLAVLHGLVGDGELARVVADRLWLDFHLVEGLVVLHTYHAPYHLRENDHVLQVGLLQGWHLLLGLSQTLEYQVLLPPQAMVKVPSLGCCTAASAVYQLSSHWSRSTLQ